MFSVRAMLPLPCVPGCEGIVAQESGAREEVGDAAGALRKRRLDRGGDHGEQHGYGDAEQPRYHLAMAVSESPLEQSSPGDRKWAPELAYSWPAVVFALTFPALFVSKILALVFLFGAFVCCPIRDAILDRFWPDSPTCAGS